MDTVIYIFALIGVWIVARDLTSFLLARFVGKVLCATDKSGKKYKVLQRPKETRQEAIARLKAKIKE